MGDPDQTCPTPTQPRPPRRRGGAWRRGSVLLYAAFIGIPVLVGVSGIAIDVGRVQLVRTELQQAADAASRYGAGGTMQGRTAALDRARAAATDARADGQPIASAEVACEYGSYVARGEAFTPKSSSAFSGNAVRVTIVRAVPLSFMSLGGGASSATVRATSTSYLPGALLVVGNAATPENDDLQAAYRLWYAGLSTDFVTAPDVVAADAAGHAVVVMSETIVASQLGTKLRDVATPLVCYEPLAFPNLAMTAAGSTNAGWTNATAEKRLAAKQGYLFGVPDNTPLEVQSSVGASGQGFGKPTSSAWVVMTQVADATRASVFYYDKGASMVGRAAPHRRAGLWMCEFSRLNSLGGSIFDSVVKLAVGNSRAVVTVR